MEDGPRTVCVTGASGFIASWLVKKLLECGYHVRAVVRDPADPKKVGHLLGLANAKERLSLWKGDLVDEGSYDDAIRGCSGVFHLATPMNFTTAKDPENEIIKMAVDGVLNVLRSCSKAKTVKRVIFTSSVAAIKIQKEPLADHYDETFWTDVDFCMTSKIFGWSYFVSKTLAEKAAWEFAKSNGLDLVTIQPPVVLGPFLMPFKPPVVEIALALFTRNAALYPMLAQSEAVHVDDACSAHIYLFENQRAEGRYICSSHTANITELARSLSQRYPEYDIPTTFEGVGEAMKKAPCSSKKLLDLGFRFKYDPADHDVGDIFAEAIETCKEKGLMPPPPKVN